MLTRDEGKTGSDKFFLTYERVCPTIGKVGAVASSGIRELLSRKRRTAERSVKVHRLTDGKYYAIRRVLTSTNETTRCTIFNGERSKHEIFSFQI